MSQKDYGCFVCEGKSERIDGFCDRCGKGIDISGQLVGAHLNGYQAKAVLGRGFYGWTLRVEDDFQSFALKVVPIERIKVATLADTEARALAACSPHPNIARFISQFRAKITIHGRETEVFCLVFEFIPNARTLGRVVEDESLRLSKGDVSCILRGIASALARMHSHGMWHNDLHDDNVLIRDVASDEGTADRFEPKLIDFGSVRPVNWSEPEAEGRSDYFYLSKHIYNLVLRFELGNRSALTPADRAYSGRLRRLAHRIADKDISRREIEPKVVAREIRLALDECATGHNYPSFAEMKKQSVVSFSDPLTNANALNLAPQDIPLLFRDSLRWQERLEKSEPVLVVGPRGCGKTMLLRYLSIASCARPLKKESTPKAVSRRLAGMKYIGFLVSVGLLRTPFLRSGFKHLEKTDPSLAEDFCREFFNTHFVFEVVRTLVWLSAEKLAGFTEDDRKLLAAAMEGLVGGVQRAQPITLEDLAEILDRRVMDLSNLGEAVYTPSALCRDDVLQRLAQTIRRTNWSADKEVWFLLDDYSATVLPSIAQLAYNPVLFRLSDDVRIKISSEGDGPVLNDSLGRRYREGRELKKINLGEIYFQANEKQGRAFFEKVLDARYKETRKGSVTELRKLLGEHEHEGSFGNYIRKLSRPGDTRFYGFGLLCCLCSGDISFIIEILHSLTEAAQSNGAQRLTPAEQDELVKRFAQRQLADLHAISDHGEKLYEFAFRLGSLIKGHLLKSSGKEADERLRIEIAGTGEFTEMAQTVHNALLRHSVLIYGGSGKSKKGQPTRKYFFRRLFAPCFPFSPSRRGCIDITVQDFNSWLTDPKRIWEEPRTDTQDGLNLNS